MVNYRSILKRLIPAVLSVFFILPGVRAEDSPNAAAKKIEAIHIVTPSWKNLTNEDGSGLYFDMIRAAYHLDGIRLEYTIVPWKRAKADILNKKADAMLAAYITTDIDVLYPEHPMDVDYTVAVFKKDNIKWEGPQSLKDKKVVWMRGYNYQNYLDFKTDWSEIDKDTHGWRLLDSGRTDAYLDIRPTIEESIKTNKIDMSKYRMETAFTINTYMRFSNTDRSRELIRIFDKRMAELMERGELKVLFEKWGMTLPEFRK